MRFQLHNELTSRENSLCALSRVELLYLKYFVTDDFGSYLKGVHECKEVRGTGTDKNTWYLALYKWNK